MANNLLLSLNTVLPIVILAAAGVITPSEELAEIPDGYAKWADEPWFVTWPKDAENFGKREGRGVLSQKDGRQGSVMSRKKNRTMMKSTMVMRVTTMMIPRAGSI